MGNIEIVYRQVATLENRGFVVGAVHFRGKPENEYAPLEWCNDEDVMDVDKFGAITIEQYEKNGYNFPDPNSDMVQCPAWRMSTRQRKRALISTVQSIPRRENSTMASVATPRPAMATWPW